MYLLYIVYRNIGLSARSFRVQSNAQYTQLPTSLHQFDLHFWSGVEPSTHFTTIENTLTSFNIDY